MLLEKLGIAFLKDLIFLRYFFVLIPSIISFAFLICEHSIREQCKAMFAEGLTVTGFCVWMVFIVIGLIVSVLSTGMRMDVFRSAYSSIEEFVFSTFYLFLTGFVEEIAWRGFLLERVSAKRKNIASVLTVGVIWAVWHIPMWTIRNASGFTDVILLFAWTVLVSIVLGIAFYQYENVFMVTVLHVIFNICYLAPIQYNIAALTLAIAIGARFIKRGIKI